MLFQYKQTLKARNYETTGIRDFRYNNVCNFPYDLNNQLSKLRIPLQQTFAVFPTYTISPDKKWLTEWLTGENIELFIFLIISDLGNWSFADTSYSLF